MLVVILDQAVKFWVTNNLLGYDVVSLIPGVIVKAKEYCFNHK